MRKRKLPRGAKKTMSVEEAQLKAAAEEINPAKLRQIPMELAVYELTGPLFFGAADRINQIEVNEVTRCLILRMRAVPAADSTAMNSMTALCERCKKNGVTLILSHVNEQPMQRDGESRIQWISWEERISAGILRKHLTMRTRCLRSK